MHGRLPTLGSGSSSGRWPLLAAAAVLAAAGLCLISGVGDALEYDRDRIAAGEWWRLATGHLAHVSADHFGWDAAAFAIGSVACIRFSPRLFRDAMFGGAAAVSLSVWALRPDLQLYRGLSGIDSALFAAAAAAVIGAAAANRDRRTVGLASACFAAFVAKATFEWATGTTVFVAATPQMTPVPVAHVAGAAAGLLAALAQRKDTPPNDLARRASADRPPCSAC